MFGGAQLGSDFDSIGSFLTLIFHKEGFLDVVVSDVVAGIVLMRMEQQARTLGGRYPFLLMDTTSRSTSTAADAAVANATTDHSCERLGLLSGDIESRGDIKSTTDTSSIKRSSSPKQLVSTNYDDCALIMELTHYCTFAVAIYSHLLAMYMHPVHAPCGLCCAVVNKTEICTKCFTSAHNCCCCCCCSCLHHHLDPKQDDNHNFSTSTQTLPEASFLYRNSNHYVPVAVDEEHGQIEWPDRQKISNKQVFPDRHPIAPLSELAASEFQSHRVVGDNCLGINEAGLLYLSKQKVNAELVYASFRNDIVAKPYAVFYGKIKLIMLCHVSDIVSNYFVCLYLYIILLVHTIDIVTLIVFILH